MALKWKLSTRHPVYDICNMYAVADLFGLGKGVFPKDALPKIPAHPHCLCRVIEVYDGEVELDQRHDDQEQAVSRWLEKQDRRIQKQLLGVQGAKEWAEGAYWQKYMRGWHGFDKPVSRLSAKDFGAISGALNDKNDPTLARRYAHAEKFYKARRKNGITAFVNKIHANTGYPINRLENIYKHVFINEHDLADGRHRFYPSYDMAQSFQRLLEGRDIHKHDLIMLKHEHLELAIMKKLGYNYGKAHDLTNTKHNYTLAERKWRENHADT